MGRRFGQHFLVRESTLEKIAVAACSDGVPVVVEIGPGKGALTKHLLNRAERVVAIEIDPYLVHYLRQKFRGCGAAGVDRGRRAENRSGPVGSGRDRR